MSTDKYHIYTDFGVDGQRFWYIDKPEGILVGGPYAHSATAFHAFRHFTRRPL